MMEQSTKTARRRIFNTDRFHLTPAGEAALAEANLTADSDAYDVCLAFDKVMAADPQNHSALTRFMARFPQFAEELIDAGFARFAFGLTLTDPVEESADGLLSLAEGHSYGQTALAAA